MGHPRRTGSMVRLAHRQSGSIDVFAELSVLLKGGHGPLLVNHQPAWRVAGVVPCEAGSADRAERKAEPNRLPHPKRVNPWHPGISAPFAANTDLQCRCRRSRGIPVGAAGPRSPAARPGRVDECAAVIRCAGVWQGVLGAALPGPVVQSVQRRLVQRDDAFGAEPAQRDLQPAAGIIDRSGLSAGTASPIVNAPSTSSQNACRSLSVSSTASHATGRQRRRAAPRRAQDANRDRR